MIVDLFSGAGGWEMGLRALGREDVVGFEIERDACRTRATAGHLTVRADVTTWPLEPLIGKVEGLIASPPCPDWSLAGGGRKRKGKTGHLVDEPLRWIEVLRPEWVAMEQVPPALVVWKEHAHRLRQLGYNAWCGLLNSADIGVPQTRTRAILMASRGVEFQPPTPTHAEFPVIGFTSPTLPWVSMAEALGWGMTARPANTLTTRTNGGGPVGDLLDGGTGSRQLHAREQREGRWMVDRRTIDHPTTGPRPTAPILDRPAPTLAQAEKWLLRPGSYADGREKGNRRTYSPDEPAPTLHFGHDSAAWCWTKPATTIAGDPRITARAHHDNGSQGANPETTAQVRAGDYEGTEPVRLTITEAAILQSFPEGHPWQGSRTSCFTQIGNAIPPLLAQAILGQIIGR